LKYYTGDNTSTLPIAKQEYIGIIKKTLKNKLRKITNIKGIEIENVSQDTFKLQFPFTIRIEDALAIAKLPAID
jgi:hypothetical protein